MMPKFKPKTLEESFSDLLKRSKAKHLSVKEILKILSGNGRILILIFLSLPFCQPLQIPGLSTPFGIAIAFIGLRMALGKKFWFPEFLLKKQISTDKIQKIILAGLQVIKKLRHLIRPRCLWICEHPFMKLSHGFIISFLGIILALPLPIPLSNLIAAWSIFLIALGMIKNDGVFIIAGYILTIVILIFFVLLIYSIIAGVNGKLFFQKNS